jgi:hypothetical protein
MRQAGVGGKASSQITPHDPGQLSALMLGILAVHSREHHRIGKSADLACAVTANFDAYIEWRLLRGQALARLATDADLNTRRAAGRQP